MKKKTILIVVLIIVFLGLIIFSNKKEPTITIAACPTFHYMLEKLGDDFKIIKTGSTSESLTMLDNNEVDLVISGRFLKPNEPNFLFKEMGPGYDFLFIKEVIITEEEMAFIPFYTNLSVEKVLNDFPYINLTKVNNVIEYLDQGVVITQNNYQGELVHVFREDGSRVRLSRKPRLYYNQGFSLEKLLLLEEIIKEN